MSPITTHVLDTARGRPAAGIPLTLTGPDGTVATGLTDDDGRNRTLLERDRFMAGRWSLRFELSGYFHRLGVPAFYPEATVVFVVMQPGEHHHVPLLLAPHGYTTYRGT